MKIKSTKYTTQLQAGLGLIDETKSLLSIYMSNMTSTQLFDTALQSGLFPKVSARRLRNIIKECFYPRYIKTEAAPYLKQISNAVSNELFTQFLLVFTAYANQILYDFIVKIYWDTYSSGNNFLSTEDAKEFVSNAVQDGKTQKAWSDSTIRRVSSYLIGCCSDYGLLSSGRSSRRQIQTIRLKDETILFFSYWLHFSGIGDNNIINHDTWKLFGLEPSDVKEELKRLAKKNWLIVQSAGNVTRISWNFKSMKEIIDVIIEK